LILFSYPLFESLHTLDLHESAITYCHYITEPNPIFYQNLLRLQSKQTSKRTFSQQVHSLFKQFQISHSFFLHFRKIQYQVVDLARLYLVIMNLFLLGKSKMIIFFCNFIFIYFIVMLMVQLNFGMHPVVILYFYINYVQIVYSIVYNQQILIQ